MKIRLLFLQSILIKREDSMMLKFTNLQQEKPTKGGWMATCMSDLKTLSLTNILEDIKRCQKKNSNYFDTKTWKRII